MEMANERQHWLDIIPVKTRDELIESLSTMTFTQYIGTVIEIPGCPDPEIILISKNNLSTKIKYYEENYEKDLTHSLNSKIKIVGVCRL